jgi:hypothetical protein
MKKPNPSSKQERKPLPKQEKPPNQQKPENRDKAERWMSSSELMPPK